jgi:hypothetical protein
MQSPRVQMEILAGASVTHPTRRLLNPSRDVDHIA